MNIAGFEKLSLVDFDGCTAATVFTPGCNFKCPFCHNASLVCGQNTGQSDTDFLSYLAKRKGLLDGVCVTGGEPTLQIELPEFLRKIKFMGYRVKLDTNGTNCNVLQHLVEQKLVDYVAMDVKNSFDAYSATVGIQNYDTAEVEKSVEYLLSNRVDYEFRTTIVQEFHKEDHIFRLAKSLKGAKKYLLQKFVDNENCIVRDLHEIPVKTAETYIKILQENGVNAQLRGY